MKKWILVLVLCLIASPTFGTEDWIDGYSVENMEIAQWNAVAEPSVAPADVGRIYYNGTSDTLKLSLDTGAYSDILTVASGGGLYLKLDQTTPQTVISGAPIFDAGLTTNDRIILQKGGDNIHIYSNVFSTDLADYGRLYFQKSHNNTVGSMTATIDNEWLGNIKYLGTNAAGAFAGGGQMTVQQDGVAGAYVPTEMKWTTYSAIGENANQVVLDSNGFVGILTLDPSVELEVTGDILASGTIAGTTLTGANVTSGADPGHTHTAGSITEGQDLDDVCDIGAATDQEISVPAIYNIAGDLKIMPDVQGDTIFYGDTDVDNAADGKKIRIKRMAAEGDTYIDIFCNQAKRGRIFCTDRLEIAGSSEINLNPTGLLTLTRAFGGAGVNDDVRQHGYIAAASDEKYIQWQVNDTDDYFTLSREDANILGFKIDMPVDLVNNAFLTIGTLGAGAITGTSLTDGTTTISGGNYTGVGNITGTDIDISAGTGNISTTGLGTFGQLTVDNIGINGAVITSDTGAISFGNENLTTTGTITGVNVTSGTDPGHIHTGITTKGSYVWTATDDPRSFPLGVSTSFVKSDDGWPSYGSVLNVRGYGETQDGSVLQLYSPYNSAFGGDYLRYRTGLFSNAGWTSWKTLVDTSGADFTGNVTATGDLTCRQLATTYSATTEAGLTIGGSRPNMVFDATGISGSGIAFNIMRADVTNTDPAKAQMGVVGVLGETNLGGTPIPTYMYFDARTNGFYNVATLKVDANDRIGIGLSGTTRPTEKVDVNGNIHLRTDNNKILFGTGKDASIYYDGTDLIVNPQSVGSGDFKCSNGAFEGNHKSSDGSAGLTATYSFGGGASGDVATLTVKDGLITAVTTVP